MAVLRHERVAVLLWRLGERMKRSRWDFIAHRGYRIMALGDRAMPWERSR